MTNTQYAGFDTNDLANFKMSVTLGFGFVSTLAERLGVAMASETDAASKSMCRLIESEPHAETPFVAECYRSAMVNQHLLMVANVKESE